MLVPAEERCSEGEAGCGGVEGEFSSGVLSLRSWLHIQKEAFRRSSEMWNHGQGKEELEMCIGESCLQMVVEGRGVAEILKGKNGKETRGGGEGRGEGRTQ